MDHTVGVDNLGIFVLKVVDVQVVNLVKPYDHGNYVFHVFLLVWTAGWQQIFNGCYLRVSQVADLIIVLYVPPTLFWNVKNTNEVSVCEKQKLRLTDEALINLHVARNALWCDCAPFFVDIILAIRPFFGFVFGYRQTDALAPILVNAINSHRIFLHLSSQVDVVEVKVDVFY